MSPPPTCCRDPASTQPAILTAWRLRGVPGGLVGGLCFICPGLALILLLSTLFLAAHPPVWVEGAAAGAGAAVPAVALQAAIALMPASLARAGAARVRWTLYLVAGGAAAVLTGPWLVLVLVAAGLTEIAVRRSGRATLPLLVGGLSAAGGLGALAWVAFKVGALVAAVGFPPG